MAFGTNEQFDFDWITWPRARVPGQLAANHTEPEIARVLGVSHTTVRSAVEAIKLRTDLRDVREIGRWWQETRPLWLEWAANQAGLRMKQDGS